MNAKDALMACKEKPKKRERQDEARQDKGRKIAKTGGRREDRRSKPPTRRFINFTPLNTPIDQVLMQIKDEGALTLPGKLKGDPSKRSRDKYCRFHCDHGHDTSDCYDLKQQIKALIRQGKLQRSIGREQTDQPQESLARLKEVLLDGSRLERTTRIGTLATPSVRQALMTFLRENQDVFAWSHEDMPGIDPSIIVHKLNVSPSFSPIRQKKRVFAQEHDKAITEEVRKLQVDFI